MELSDVRLGNSFICAFCGQRYRKWINLQWHKLHHTNFIQKDTNLLQCPRCKYTCHNDQKFKMHFLAHFDSKNVQCTICNFNTYYKSALIAHYKSFHMAKSLDKELDSLTCSTCNFKAATSKEFISHKAMSCSTLNKSATVTDTCKKVYSCYQCSFNSTDKAELKDHISTHEEKKPMFKCPYCAYTSTFKSHVTIHKKTHVEDKKKRLKCYKCSFYSYYPLVLKKHIKAHAENRLINICKTCQCCLASKACLQRHVLREHGMTQKLS